MKDARRVAVELVRRIDEDGAYANLLVPSTLERSRLDRRDRAFVTEVAYGATRMRRACDFLVDRYLLRPVDPAVRAALRIGAYQLEFMRVPAHAAVGATVAVTPGPARGLVNAVLRRVAEAPVVWPDDVTRLSYPDWVAAALTAALGEVDAVAALEQMNQPARATVRADGYVQDMASQWVADLVEVAPGHRVADLCAAPGGKATGLASATNGGLVVAGDVNPRRAGLISANARRLGVAGALSVVAADAGRPPLRRRSFDRVLLDAPCSGLGTLRRRPDARWRVEPAAVERLAGLQREMIDASVPLLRPGGLLVYSVCTMTTEETGGVDDHVAERWPDLVPVAAPGAPWARLGRGALLLPQAAGTDGMALFRYRLGR